MPSHLLSLPRELRDAIYFYVVFEPDGYHFDFESRKFRRAPGDQPINLAWRLTTKSVAAETRHLALECNFLNFSTGFSEAGRLKAGHFHILCEQMEYHKITLLEGLKIRALSRYKSPKVDRKITQRYPQFETLLPGLTEKNVPYSASGRDPDSWGVAESYFRGFLDYLIEVLSTETGFIDAYIGICNRRKHAFCDPDILPFIRSKFLLSSPVGVFGAPSFLIQYLLTPKSSTEALGYTFR